MAILLVLCLAVPDARQAPAGPSEEDLSVQSLLTVIEATVLSGDRDAWRALLSANASVDAALEFYETVVPTDVTRAVARERDRVPLVGALPGEGLRLIFDVFTERGRRGRITTWRLDVRRLRDSADKQPWRVIAHERLSVIDGLHRLTLATDQQFTARNLRIASVDFELHLRSGEVFVSETNDGVTALVLLGDGTMRFTPGPSEERGQVRIFAGTETLDSPFSAAYVRLNPFDFETDVKAQLTAAAAPDARQTRRAQTVFDEEVGKSFTLDLQDLSRENWSLLPQSGDFLAEVRTRRHGALTYARSTGEAEDVTLFQRSRRRNIAAYASESKLASRGRFFNEDNLVEYDVVDYSIDTSFTPEREWLDGRTRMRIRIKSFALAALTLRLAEGLNVSSITSDELGRLMFLRVRNQTSVVVNLPSPVSRDTELTLNITYAGRMPTQPIDQESIAQEGGGRGQPRADELPYIPAERNWLFSNRAQWYPQGQVSDFATGTIRFTVPLEYTAVASGVPDDEPIRAPSGTGQPARHTFSFRVAQPVRYFGALVSKFSRVESASVALDIMPDPSAAAPTNGALPLGARNTVQLAVEANRRQMDRGRNIVDTAAEILRFYSSIIGDAPYESLTVAMVEHERPGGHSPGYFVVLNNPLPVTPFQFRNDPATFTSFPEFFVAHEVAHQWWGQAVGWKNYHEQWLSEGFAQYFAALYARERRGEQTFREVLRQLRRWAVDQSDQGAVYLGYRLGHIKGDSRVFRALVYNKGATVLHMLRRMLGDDAFFGGLRRYYAENRFRKAGTEDLQRAMEAEAGRSLDRFFEQWIYQSTLPHVRYGWSVDGQDVVVRLEFVGEPFDLPVTVSLQYTDRTVDEIVVAAQGSMEARFPLAGTLRGVELNADHAALGTFDRR